MSEIMMELKARLIYSLTAVALGERHEDQILKWALRARGFVQSRRLGLKEQDLRTLCYTVILK